MTVCLIITLLYSFNTHLQDSRGVCGKIEEAINQFVLDHREMGLTSYTDILDAANIGWNCNAMKSVDVSVMNGETVMALLIATLRADYGDGKIFRDFWNEGYINNWLERLKEIDQETGE